MTIFFNLRVRPAGGEIANEVRPCMVSITPETNKPEETPLSLSELGGAVLGRRVILVTHGFNVHQDDGYRALSNWQTLIDLDESWLFIGVVWPGDSSWLGPLCYPGEGQHAMKAGNLLAKFLNDNLGGAKSVSFVSHSLGARFILQTIASLNQLNPGFAVEQFTLMAGAINYDCLTNEYAGATQSVGKINLLASTKDEVLAAAFPAGNVFEGIIDAGHPWFQSALGRKGPKSIPPGKTPGRWQVPDSWNFGHGSYLLVAPPTAPSIAPPDDELPSPSVGNPVPPYLPGRESSFAAAFVKSRFK